MNIRFVYLYRDAGNNKRWGEVVFANPSRMSPERIERELRLRLIDGEYLIVSEVNLPPLFFARYDPELDHSWHQYSCLEETEEEVNDGRERTIEEFIEEIGRSFGSVKN